MTDQRQVTAALDANQLLELIRYQHMLIEHTITYKTAYISTDELQQLTSRLHELTQLFTTAVKPLPKEIQF